MTILEVKEVDRINRILRITILRRKNKKPKWEIDVKVVNGHYHNCLRCPFSYSCKSECSIFEYSEKVSRKAKLFILNYTIDPIKKRKL